MPLTPNTERKMIKVEKGENAGDETCDHCGEFLDDDSHIRATTDDGRVWDLHDDCAIMVAVQLIQLSEATWPSDEDDV